MTNTVLKPLILPQNDNLITPFILEPDTDSENTVSYILQILCSESLKEHIEFIGKEPQICTKASTTDTVSNLNVILQNTYARLKNEGSKVSDLRITYIIIYSENGKDPLTFEQQFVVSTEIPINRVNKVIYYQSNSSTTFDLKILEIQDSYFRNAVDHEFIVIFDDKGFPDWLKFQFESNALYFSGRTSLELSTSYSFSFRVQDKVTGLLSESVTMNVVNSIESEVSGNKALIIVLFLIFTGIIACILLIVFISSKKKQNDEKNLQKSVNAQNKQFQDTTSTPVLSDSILKWNEKLVERHRNKNFDFLDTDDERSRPERSPGFAYEKFDDTFEMTEDDKNLDIKISDKLSEIRPDDEARGDTDGNKSSFFDDIRF